MKSKKERIEIFHYVVEDKGYTPTEIANKTGFDRGNVSKMINHKLNISEKFLYKFEEVFQINLNDIILENNTKNTRDVLLQQGNKGVPYFENIDGTATITTSFSDYPESPAFYIDYEHFNDCDAYIQVVGDSMYPAYSSGEIIAVKRIMNFDVIQWGEVYFVVTNGNANDMKTVKQLHYHEDLDKIILRSSNPNFKGDTVVKKKDILYLYIVKGKIRRNQL